MPNIISAALEIYGLAAQKIFMADTDIDIGPYTTLGHFEGTRF